MSNLCLNSKVKTNLIIIVFIMTSFSSFAQFNYLSLNSSRVMNGNLRNVTSSPDIQFLDIDLFSNSSLQVATEVENPVICQNEATTIKAIPSGGSNNYISYRWSSIPAGFTSSEIAPVVSPTITTVYTVEVNDGFNTAIGNITVTVNQLPVINFTLELLSPSHPNNTIVILGPNIYGVCVFDTLSVDAGNPGSVYLWSGDIYSNNPTTQSILLSTSGLSFDNRDINVIVTNPTTGCSSSEDITIMFNFIHCNYGGSKKEQTINNQSMD